MFLLQVCITLYLCSNILTSLCIVITFTPSISSFYTEKKLCLFPTFSSLASFALHGEQPTLCTNSGFVFLFFFHFFFNVFHLFHLWQVHSEVLPATIVFFFFRAAQTQSAPIKHKVLFSPVDVVIPPTLENWQKQQWKQYSMLPSLELKKTHQSLSKSCITQWKALYTCRWISSFWSLSTCFIFPLASLHIQCPFRKESRNV